MTRSHIFFKRPYVPIWLLLTMLVFTACSSPALEPSVESSTDLAIGDSQTQQSYPAPEQQLVGERLQSGYPGPLPNAIPVRPTPLPTPIPPPNCEFRLPVEIDLTPLTIDSYSFSAPEFVPLSQQTSGFGISGWLPDSQRLLVTDGDTAFGTISIVNANTGKMQQFAERRDITSDPIWLSKQQGIAFVDATKESGWVLRFSRGRNIPVQTLQEDLASVHLSMNPETEEIAALLPGLPASPVSIATSGKVNHLSDTFPESSSISVSLSSSDASRLAWSPDGRWLIQYGTNGAFLTDVASRQTCSLDLGFYPEQGYRWGIHAQWSFDNQYLAIITTVNFPGELLRPTELTVLNFRTGTIHIFKPNSEIEPWKHFVNDLAWSPDGQEIITKVTVGEDNGIFLDGLYIVDVVNHKSTRLLSENTFYSGTIGQGLAWAPNGKLLALTCPGGPLCLVEIAKQR